MLTAADLARMRDEDQCQRARRDDRELRTRQILDDTDEAPDPATESG